MIPLLSCKAHSLGRPGSVQCLSCGGLDSGGAPSAIALWTASLALAAMFRFGGSRLRKGLGHRHGVLQCLFSAATATSSSLPFVVKLPVPRTTSKWQPLKPKSCFSAWASAWGTQPLKSTLPGGWGSLGVRSLGSVLAFFQEQRVGPFLQRKGRVVGSAAVFCVHYARCSKG